MASFPQQNPRSRPSALLLGSVVIGMAATACNFKYEKYSDGSGENSSPQKDSVGYAQIYASIIRPKCLGCHATKKPVLTTYESLLANEKGIWDEVLVKHTMPKKAVLSDDLQRMLRIWCDAGMPREGTIPDPIPTNVGGVPRPYTFANLKADVLETKCNTCHATGNHDGLTPLDTYASTMSVEEWLKPLIFGMNGKDPVPAENIMPPAKSAPMTDEDKALLLLWYADGKRNEYGFPAPSATPPPESSPDPSPTPTPLPSSEPHPGVYP